MYLENNPRTRMYAEECTFEPSLIGTVGRGFKDTIRVQYFIR